MLILSNYNTDHYRLTILYRHYAWPLKAGLRSNSKNAFILKMSTFFKSVLGTPNILNKKYVTSTKMNLKKKAVYYSLALSLVITTTLPPKIELYALVISVKNNAIL
jgi:hypothetical protein